MLRTLLISLLSVFVAYSNASAQLVAHAGRDVLWCNASFSASGIVLGGSPAATGGTPPYLYEWISLDFTNASHYLDAVSAPNPSLVGYPVFFTTGDSVHLVLKVTDATAAIATDTVTVRFTFFAIIITPEVDYYKGTTDTVKLSVFAKSQYSPGGAEAPATFQWTPTTYLVDNTVGNPKCYAPVNTVYTSKVIDRYGCVFGPDYQNVHVSTSVKDYSSGSGISTVSPNPLIQNARIQIPSSFVGSTFTLFDATGRKAKQLQLQAEQTTLHRDKDMSPGIYFYHIEGTSGSFSGKLLIE